MRKRRNPKIQKKIDEKYKKINSLIEKISRRLDNNIAINTREIKNLVAKSDMSIKNDTISNESGTITSNLYLDSNKKIDFKCEYNDPSNEEINQYEKLEEQLEKYINKIYTTRKNSKDDANNLIIYLKDTDNKLKNQANLELNN